MSSFLIFFSHHLFSSSYHLSLTYFLIKYYYPIVSMNFCFFLIIPNLSNTSQVPMYSFLYPKSRLGPQRYNTFSHFTNILSLFYKIFIHHLHTSQTHLSSSTFLRGRKGNSLFYLIVSYLIYFLMPYLHIYFQIYISFII